MQLIVRHDSSKEVGENKYLGCGKEDGAAAEAAAGEHAQELRLLRRKEGEGSGVVHPLPPYPHGSV